MLFSFMLTVMKNLLLFFIFIVFSNISFANSNALKPHLACDHALEGSPHAAEYISQYLYQTGEECSGDLFLLISILLKDPLRTKHPKLETKCLMSIDVHRMAHLCARDMSQCLRERRTKILDTKNSFFKEYFNRVPMGWPEYSKALDTYLMENPLKCIID